MTNSGVGRAVRARGEVGDVALQPGEVPGPGLQFALANGAPVSIVPGPEHVRAAVAAELGSRGVTHPQVVAVALLPQASLM